MNDSEMIDEMAERIAELERQVALLTTRVVSIDACHMEHIEKLEAALRDMVHCLIGGKVDVDTALPNSDTFHEHHILGIGPAMTMAGVYHQFKE